MEIGILGGSFNPIHLGHLYIAQEVCKKKNLDKVLLVPSKIPPHKDKSDLLPAPLRLKMVQRAVEDYPNLEVSPIEINRPGVSYTIDTIREFQQEFPNDLFYFIIGSDMLEGLHSWRDIHHLLELCPFLIVHRPDYPIQWNLLNSFSPEEIKKLQQGIVEIKPVEISSTMVRKAMKEGKDLTHLVPPGIIPILNSLKL
ncbi:MAG: nicotinate (nicotinamide) nucleotide adenylyltransferase [Planctomycetota bacterium]|nr:MAG: nicotinate (nicotinamide) nucleotide adenylyltransferase [Planctomycetota bacterium]